MGKVVVAWVSRHKPLKSQIRELQRLLGHVEVVQINNTFANVKEVLCEIKGTGAKVAVVVLPLSMISQLLPLARNEGIDLWMAKMKGLHECVLEECKEFNQDTDVWLPLRGSNKGRHMRFEKFVRIKRVEVVTEELEG